MRIVNVADLTNPKTGKTYRQENNELKHKYRVGDWVKLKSGRYAQITKCTRDCDGTPLYNYELGGLSEGGIVEVNQSSEVSDE